MHARAQAAPGRIPARPHMGEACCSGTQWSRPLQPLTAAQGQGPQPACHPGAWPAGAPHP